MRRKILKIYGGILSVGLGYLILTSVMHIDIPCFYFATTGFLCPGCGVTRMFLSLARLDFAEAFSYNPVVFVLLILWNGIALLCFCGKTAFVKDKRFLYTVLGLSIAALLIFGFVRNLP